MGDIFGDLFGDMFHGGSWNEEANFSGGNFSGGKFSIANFSGGKFSRSGRGFSGSGFGNASDSRAGNLTAEVSVSFEEAVLGCEKTITFQNPGDPSGKTQSLRVKIPAGIESGKSIRLAGKGMPAKGGRPAGDLLLRVTVEEKTGWERKGLDLYTSVEIPFTTAVFGGEALVHTLYGDVMCRIKEGTQSGTKIRLRGKGVVSMTDPSVRGDEYAQVRIQVPRNLDAEAKQKLREYEEVLKKKGRQHAA